MDKGNEGRKVIFATAEAPPGHSPAEVTTVTEKHLALINGLQASKGKQLLTADEVLVRPMRLSGNSVTAIYTRFYERDLRKLAAQVPGAPLLKAHDTTSEPLGTFYYAEVTREGDSLWLDGWFYVLNNEDGRKLVERVDKGVFNEASISWTFTEAVCSVCGRDYYGEPDENGIACQHWRGQEYDGQLCYIYTTGDVEFLEGSIVYRGAHPGTRVGGDFLRAAASAAGGVILGEADDKKKAILSAGADSGKSGDTQGSAGMVEESYVPPNPSDYSVDDDASWSKPTFGDFLSALGEDSDTSWGDLPANKKKWIASHFAWAPSSDVDAYAFSELKLPHHTPGAYPKSILKWGGVKAAAQRLAGASIPDSDMGQVKNHLAAHYREFNRTAPWEEEESSWNEYVDALASLASGFVTDELLARVASLSTVLFNDDKEGDDMVEFELKIGDESLTFSGEAADVVAQLQGEIDKVMSSMAASLEDANAKVEELSAKVDEFSLMVEELSAKAQLGEAYVNDLRDEIVELAVRVDGADSVEGYTAAVEALAAAGNIDALKSERGRLQAKLAELPNERKSVEDWDEDGSSTMSQLPPKELDSFKQR